MNTVRLLSASAILIVASHGLHAQATRGTPFSLQSGENSVLAPQQYGATTFGGGGAPTAAPSYQLAPMPNNDLNAPIDKTPQTAGIAPSLFQPRKQFRGDGFSAGSTAQAYQEQRVKPAPGVSLKVPLE